MAEQSILGGSDVFKEWAEIGMAAPGQNAENFPAALPENAIAPDVLAPELTSNVDVVIAVDLDVELDPFVEQREIQFIAGDTEFGVGLEAGVPQSDEAETDITGEVEVDEDGNVTGRVSFSC